MSDTPFAGDTSPHATLRTADALVFVDNLELPTLSVGDAHHLRNVLRLGGRSLVIAADGAGNYRTCRLSDDGSARTRNRREKNRSRPASTHPDIAGGIESPDDLAIDSDIIAWPRFVPVTVAFAIVKGDRNDWAVQKLTEIGVDRIVPLICERSVIRMDDRDIEKRGERFRRIAKEAACQSRRPALPEVKNPTPFAKIVNAIDAVSRHHVAIAEPGGDELGSAIDTIFVGPEGGWSPSELACNLRPVDLGPTVLRAETAAIVAGVRLISRRTLVG